MKYLWVLGFICLWNFQLPAVAGTVRIIKKDPRVAAAVGDFRDTVVIEGEIDTSLERAFIADVLRQKVVSATVYINSPGGSLFSGIRLGREIRKRGFETRVGRWVDGKNPDQPGACYSAAVLTFLGGRYRWCDPRSKIGVHRFFSADQANQSMDLAQVVSAAIVSYLKEMGIDPELLDRMARVSGSEILVLQARDLRGLNVTNDGILPATWNIEVSPQAIYLKAEQETWRGTGKLLFNFLPGKGLYILAVYEGGANAQVIAGTERYSLRIDDEFSPIAAVEFKPSVRNGFVSVAFKPTAAQLLKLRAAKEIGFAFHPPNPDIFYGFTIPVPSERAKFDDFISFCQLLELPR